MKAHTTAADGEIWIDLHTPLRNYGHFRLGLRGTHQVPNALVAVRLLEELPQFGPLPMDAVLTGLTSVRWPGRLEMITTAQGRRVLLDAAHNPAGAASLASYLRSELKEPVPLVFAAMRDKNAAEMLRILVPAVSNVIVTQPAISRAMPARELAELARSLFPSAGIEVMSHVNVSFAFVRLIRLPAPCDAEFSEFRPPFPRTM